MSSQTELQAKANSNPPTILTNAIRTSPPDDQALPMRSGAVNTPLLNPRQPIPVLAPKGDQSPNLGQNEGNGGYALHSTSVYSFPQ